MNDAPIAVIGMHRSGTSCLAGCLQDLGLNLGEVITEAPHNRKGNRENPRLWDVHDAVLARVGAAWDRPAAQPVAWTATEIAALKAILADYEGLPRPWGFKDPRATMLLDGWFEAVPDLRLIGSYRHPLAVAASLAKRDAFPLDRSLAIWTAHNETMLAWRDRVGGAIIDYDVADYERRVREAARALGLDADRPMPFREAELNHNQSRDPVPASVAGLWDRLRDASA